MADEAAKDKKGKEQKETSKPTVPKTALEIQRLQYERLMKDPVSDFEIMSLHFEEVFWETFCQVLSNFCPFFVHF